MTTRVIRRRAQSVLWRVVIEVKMTDVEKQLRSAIKLYRALLESFISAEQNGVMADDSKVVEFAVRLEPLQVAARELDGKLAAELRDGAEPLRDHRSLVQGYQVLMKEVFGRYSALLARARTHHALVAAELTELREGKKALAGYRAMNERTRSKLSETY